MSEQTIISIGNVSTEQLSEWFANRHGAVTNRKVRGMCQEVQVAEGSSIK
jgi:ribonuclease I